MRLCDETITIVNAKLDNVDGYDVYTGTVIKGVSWYCEIASNVDSSGLKAANKFTVRIPTDADFSSKSYVDPITYAEDGDPNTQFTLKSGDVVVKGEVTGSNLRPKDLLARYETFTILGVSDNRRALNEPHWKVVGS